MNASIVTGDCRAILPAQFEPETFHACVCDPPYELGFLGKQWDKTGVSFDPATWAAIWRALKPGAHLVAFGGARTFHRIAVAIEDGGFEIRDTLCWLFGNGFPKSHNLTGEHAGWGTALKPAFEPIILARKPFRGTVAGNVIAHGAGAINIDGCRIAHRDQADYAESVGKNQHDRYANPGSNRDSYSGAMPTRSSYDGSRGRWPANVVLDDQAAAMLDAQSGDRTSGGKRKGERRRDYSEGGYMGWPSAGDGYDHTSYGDTGGPSRFFYTAKASRAERGAGNEHPTVKPIELMQWLVRLVAPAGGIVLDPFAGSGTTGIAADREGFDFVGIEIDSEYAELARRRIAGDAPLFASPST